MLCSDAEEAEESIESAESSNKLLCSEAQHDSRPRYLRGVRPVLLALGLTVGVLALALWGWSAHDHMAGMALSSGPGRPDFLQMWYPTTEDEVLPFKKWLKAWHVKPGKLTHVIYDAYAHHPTFLKEKRSMDEMVRWQTEHDCPKQEVGVDFTTRKAFPIIWNVPSAAICQKACSVTPSCAGFTYGAARDKPGLTDACFRKRLLLGEGITKSSNPDVVSGLPCRRERHDAWWPVENRQFYEMPKQQLPELLPAPATCDVEMTRSFCIQDMEAPNCDAGYTPVRTEGSCTEHQRAFSCCPAASTSLPAPGATMHCVALFRAFSYEQELIVMQHSSGASIFQCESHAVYSSQVIEIAPGLVSRRIASSMMAEVGGQFVTVTNLAIFLALYRQIIMDADYLNAGWTIKVDPDTVWLPARLRPILRQQSWGVGGDGIYLNNCPEGLHGPIEIFSQSAFRALGDHAAQCAHAMDGPVCENHCESVFQQTKVCNGNCTDWWGEDIWADQCLHRFSEAKRVLVNSLLLEAHCKSSGQAHHVNVTPSSCRDSSIVAFHPFKTENSYTQCLSNARESAGLTSRGQDVQQGQPVTASSSGF
eukprot:TRINITY_DN111149_c0_g1_i1.p1 TRINITY_DN111149_c0_g1~~TRINITY_DN111149_c0_g1_i1.p1  ORF type:complete len:617 (-),score=107.21 TRINITY_DN111149_c0_g1_i1:112-1884(-)